MKDYFRFFLSMATLVIVGGVFVSCGGGSGISETANDVEDTITGKAIDGYLSGSTVCLDLDGDGACCSSSEPTTTSDSTGSYTLTLSDTHKKDSNFNKASVIVYGGVDVDSDQIFIGKLKATNNGNSTINVTPATTLIDSMDLSYDEAKAKVAEIFGIDVDSIESDPIASNKPDLFAKAVAMQRAVDLLVLADDSTDTNSVKANKIMTAIASGLKGKSGNLTIENIIDSIDKTNVNTKAQNALKLAVQLATITKTTYKDINNRGDYAKICDSYTQDAKQIITDNGLTEQITDAEIKAFEEKVQQKAHFQAVINGTIKDISGKAYANRTVFLRDNTALDSGNGGFYTTQTDDSGNYSFLIFNKGTYTLWVRLAVDEEQTAPSPGGKNIVFNDTGAISTAGTTSMDFVVKKLAISNTSPYTITPPTKAIFYGKVFADKNGNNIFDTGEQVFKNADVFVQDITNGGYYNPRANANGDYAFSAYEVGKFKIWINAHRFDKYNSNVILPVASNAGNLPFYEFYLNPADNKKIDFVIQDKGTIPVTVSGRFYYDDDSSGDYNAGDRPIYKRQVFLVPDNGEAPIYRLTDNDGKYSFDIVPTSTSGIKWALKPSLKGKLLNSPTLVSGYKNLGEVNVDTNQDFVFTGTTAGASNVVLKGKVYIDKNDNGAYDEGTDTPAPNVTIYLRNKTLADAGNGGFYTTTSDSNGDYSFIDTTGGEYKIWFALPYGKKETTCDASVDWSADSLCGGIVFHTRNYSLGDTPTMDFGYTNK